jgi:hypothetical protein
MTEFSNTPETSLAPLVAVAAFGYVEDKMSSMFPPSLMGFANNAAASYADRNEEVC